MEVVFAAKPRIKKCVEQQKAADPDAGGEVRMRWSIKPDGSVANVQTVSDEFRKTPLSNCLAALIKSWRFPAYSGAAMDPIDFPFKF